MILSKTYSDLVKVHHHLLFQFSFYQNCFYKLIFLGVKASQNRPRSFRYLSFYLLKNQIFENAYFLGDIFYLVFCAFKKVLKIIKKCCLFFMVLPTRQFFSYFLKILLTAIFTFNSAVKLSQNKARCLEVLQKLFNGLSSSIPQRNI